MNSELINFIKEARKKGYQDYQIKEILFKYNWPVLEVEKAFNALNSPSSLNYSSSSSGKSKTKIGMKNCLSIYIDSEVFSILQKRAKKNLLTIEEQISDIIRRSCVNQKKRKVDDEKLDDFFVSLFSRKSRGKPRR